MRLICGSGEVGSAGIACLPQGTDNNGDPTSFETVVYPSGVSLKTLQEEFGPEIYVIRDPA